MCDDARNAVGTGSTGPEERQEAYARRLFPEHEDARTRPAMADSMYSCALSGLAALRAAEVDARELHEPYSTHIGAALAWLGSIARRMNAYVDLSTRAACDAAAPFKAGDILVVEGPVHVIVLTDRASDVLDGVDDGDDFITSEGGMPEVDPHTREKGMCIHSRRMRLRRTDGRVHTGTVNKDGTVTWGRAALYAINLFYVRRTDE